MTTYLINQKTKDRIEVLDMGIQFMEGMTVAVPKWGNKQIVVEVVLLAQVSGQQCSLVQHVFCNEKENE